MKLNLILTCLIASSLVLMLISVAQCSITLSTPIQLGYGNGTYVILQSGTYDNITRIGNQWYVNGVLYPNAAGLSPTPTNPISSTPSPTPTNPISSTPSPTTQGPSKTSSPSTSIKPHISPSPSPAGSTPVGKFNLEIFLIVLLFAIVLATILLREIKHKFKN